jgi:hypothetical protein
MTEKANERAAHRGRAWNAASISSRAGPTLGSVRQPASKRVIGIGGRYGFQMESSGFHSGAVTRREHKQTNEETIMYNKKGTIVTLTDDEIERCENFARELVAHYSNGETMAIMPWSRDKLSDDELRQWLASRKEAGRVIDIENCELGWWYAELSDPYGIYKALGEFSEEDSCVGRERFVRSPESNGWISEVDLPEEKLNALRERIKRAGQH